MDREEVLAALDIIADPDGRIPLPMFDQHGQKIGISRRKPCELRSVEAFVDENGTAWLPPTAWAYYAVCKARDNAIAAWDKRHAP